MRREESDHKTSEGLRVILEYWTYVLLEYWIYVLLDVLGYLNLNHDVNRFYVAAIQAKPLSHM